MLVYPCSKCRTGPIYKTLSYLSIHIRNHISKNVPANKYFLTIEHLLKLCIQNNSQ